MLKLRIVHKVLALALLPLVFNTVWIALFSSSLSRARDLMDREHKQTVILTHLNQATVLVGSAFGQLASFASNGNELHRQRSQELQSQVRQEITALRQLSPTDTKMQQLLDELSATIDEDMHALEALDNKAGEADLLARVKKLRNFVKQAGLKNKIMMAIMVEKQAELEQIARSEEQAENNVRTIVISGLISNFVLAVLLILSIVKDVTGRLRILVDNAHLLPKNVPLTGKVTGVDELAELDKELHAANLQLIESAEYRHGLMQMMAHDLKSPLAASMVSLELLEQNKSDLPASAQKQLGLLTGNLKTSLALVNDLLLLDSLEVGHIVVDAGPENLRELIDTAAQTVNNLALIKNIAIKNEAAREYANVDRNRILQVVTNFLSNAIKFSPSGSQIRVTTTKEDGLIRVTVIDQGPGLSAQDSSKLFQKFHQTKEGKKAGGTGLGLAIAKLIVESHGGTVGVNSEPGKGAEFWFTLPVE